MAADEASANEETAEPLITRVVRAVTQPGGMDIDWTKVSAAGAVIAGLSVIHGLRHHRWRYTHTFGVVLGIGAAAAARLEDKYVVTARRPESK
jgi:orotate phosphoribosyltransferase-like protein